MVNLVVDIIDNIKIISENKETDIKPDDAVNYKEGEYFYLLNNLIENEIVRRCKIGRVLSDGKREYKRGWGYLEVNFRKIETQLDRIIYDAVIDDKTLIIRVKKEKQ